MWNKLCDVCVVDERKYSWLRLKNLVLVVYLQFEI